MIKRYYIHFLKQTKEISYVCVSDSNYSLDEAQSFLGSLKELHKQQINTKTIHAQIMQQIKPLNEIKATNQIIHDIQTQFIGHFLSPFEQLNLVVFNQGPDLEEEFFKNYKAPNLSLAINDPANSRLTILVVGIVGLVLILSQRSKIKNFLFKMKKIK